MIFEQHYRKTKLGREHFVKCDLDGFIANLPAKPIDQAEESYAWYGGMTFAQSAECARNGDLSSVPESDKLLREIESIVPMSRRYAVRDDVVGAFPNVPAMLTGNPCHMRRRVRVAAPNAPLAICLSMASSACLPASDMRRRGIAMLALVRQLTNIRPVELYACVELGEVGVGSSIAIKIDTTPLDLSRAAHVLSHPSFTRGLGYEMCQRQPNEHLHTCPFGSNHRTQLPEYLKALYREKLMPNAEMLYVPMIHAHDQYLKQPVAWLKDMISKHGGIALAA